MKIQRDNLQNWMATFAGILFLASLGPILRVAPYVRSTGDDLNYSAGVHHALESGAGVWGVLQTVCDTAKGTWYSWQGTWSSVALFSLQPGIWGNQWYPITVAVALLCIVAGTWYFFHTMARLLGMNRSGRWTIAFLMGILLIQYLPNDKCGLFWWTSVAHYMIPYGITMMCMGWSLRWLESGRICFLIGTFLGMVYLGGAGYPEVVLAAVWFFLLILFGSANELIGRARAAGGRHAFDMLTEVCEQQKADGTCRSLYNRKEMRKRALWLCLPLLLEMIGFAVSAAAPGNKNRGGEDFGFSVSRVVHALVGCVQEGFTETFQEFPRVRPLILFVMLVIVLAWICMDTEHAAWKVRHPFLLALSGFAMICLIRAPVIYAEADPSGGVPDSYWLISMTIVTVCLVGITGWARQQYEKRACRKTEGKRIDRHRDRPVEVYAVGLALLLCLFMYRHIIGNTVDYTCVQFASSGALADYHEQMEEWLSILENPAIKDAELPAMNDEQGPFMLMVPLEDENAWSSSVYARYYEKDSVRCVPRQSR